MENQMGINQLINSLVNQTGIPPERRSKIEKMIRQLIESNEMLAASEHSKIVVAMGSAREPSDSYIFKLATAFGRVSAQAGFDCLSGGGSGTMAAFNGGAFEACPESTACNTRSIGLNLQAPWIWEADRNHFQTHPVYHADFATRLWTFFDSPIGVTFFPGGIGTKLEVAYGLNTLQCGVHEEIPLILIEDGNFWDAEYDMFKKQLAREYINKSDMRFLKRVLIKVKVKPTEDPKKIEAQAKSILKRIQNWPQRRLEMIKSDFESDFGEAPGVLQVHTKAGQNLLFVRADVDTFKTLPNAFQGLKLVLESESES
ncbi:hypothetical protein BH10CYA1_BH10CYA1_53870 [soil metagenome]